MRHKIKNFLRNQEMKKNFKKLLTDLKKPGRIVRVVGSNR